MIPVNGDESVDLENTQLYKKASRSSFTYVKTILQSPCCSSQLTVFIKVHLVIICSITAKKNALFSSKCFLNQYSMRFMENYIDMNQVNVGPLELASQRALQKRLQNTKF